MPDIILRPAIASDVDALTALEEKCFTTDRLSRRRFQHWVKASNCLFYVAEGETQILGYGLVLLHKGTRLARLYSIAIDVNARGLGVGARILETLEEQAVQCGRLFMRLEVAKSNDAAIKLYEKYGYKIFGEYSDYYEDHQDALRMQKRIRKISAPVVLQSVPWYRQTTDFTCGPSSLMMAMGSLTPDLALTQELELDIWREATTIFMTSGHGGCHPIGLALAAHERGYSVEVILNIQHALFIEGVRSEQKKNIMTTVDQQFRKQAIEKNIAVRNDELTQNHLQEWLQEGYAVMVLISTYRLDGRKVPHWVTVTAMDEQCFYVHDPDPDDLLQSPLDCQHMPIAREDFARMSAFGSERLRTALALHRPVKGSE